VTPRIKVEVVDASRYKEMRPIRRRQERAMVSHLFTDDDYWWPYRSALCGREFDGKRLTGERPEVVEMCLQCRKRAGLERKGRRTYAA
jgi:hypothetical protein